MTHAGLTEWCKCIAVRLAVLCGGAAFPGLEGLHVLLAVHPTLHLCPLPSLLPAGQPAIHKLKLLPLVEEVLTTKRLHSDLLDAGLLGGERVNGANTMLGGERVKG